MVGKLLKHELIRIARTAAVPVVAMIGLAIILRISLINSEVDSATAIVIGFYSLSVVATIFVCAWVGITRFYRTLFTSEGYMTLSLPVTADQLILSKLLSSLIAVVCGVVVCVLSALILAIGQDVSVWQIIGEVFNEIFSIFPVLAQAIGGLALFEIILLLIVMIPESLLLFYLVMSIGQLFTGKANRTVISVAIYFIGAFVWSLIYTLIGMPLLTSASNVSPHLALWIMIIFTIAVDVASYFIVRYIIKNKVNLIA